MVSIVIFYVSLGFHSFFNIKLIYYSIIGTNVQDLKSQLALSLRRLMLIKLANKDFEDPQKKQEMIEKYKDCIIPVSYHFIRLFSAIFLFY